MLAASRCPFPRRIGILHDAVLPLLHAPIASVRWGTLAAAAIFCALAVFWSESLRPLNRLWQKVGLLLPKVIGRVVLAVIFYGVMSPIGLLMRVCGKDPLRLRRSEVASYWIVRQPAGADSPSMKNQF